MTIDYTPLIDALNRHSAALEAYLRQPEPEPRKKKAAPAPAPEPEQPAAPEPEKPAAAAAPEPEQPAATEPEPEQLSSPEPEPDQTATDDHGITYEQIQAATKPLTVIPEAVAEWKDYLLAEYNTRVSRGVDEKHYPALLAKAEELKAKYL
jgi:hypothetical protein